MNDSDAKKLYDEYMKSWYSAENIAKAGGVKNHAAIIRKFKKNEKKLKLKNKLYVFIHGELPFIVAFAILLIIAKMLFFSGLTYFSILLITMVAGLIWVILMNINI